MTTPQHDSPPIERPRPCNDGEVLSDKAISHALALQTILDRLGTEIRKGRWLDETKLDTLRWWLGAVTFHHGRIEEVVSKIQDQTRNSGKQATNQGAGECRSR
jgi:hypothetical protein